MVDPSDGPPSWHVEQEIADLRATLVQGSARRRKRVAEGLVLAALEVVPWVGGFLAALIGLKGDVSHLEEDDFQRRWLEVHHKKLQDLESTLHEIVSRLESLGPEVAQRIESDEYLDLVRKAFRVWERADTAEKRRLVVNLVTNAGGTRITSDDVIRLFLDWLDTYHEAHFAVVRHVYTNAGATRLSIWTTIWGAVPRESAPEADFFRLLIRDLSTGGIIRQERQRTPDGRFVRSRPVSRSPGGSRPQTLESSFDDVDRYELTELGRQFVSYAMNELVPRLPGSS